MNQKYYISQKVLTSIFKNAFFMIAGNLLYKILRALYIIVIAIYLEPDLFGMFSYAMSYYIPFFVLTNLGVDKIISNSIACDKSAEPKIVGHTFSLKLIISLITALIFGMIGIITEDILKVKILFVIISIALVGRSMAIWAQQVFTAYEISIQSFRQQIIFRPLEIICAMIAVASGFSILVLAAIHALSWCLQAFSGLQLVRHHFKTVSFKNNWKQINYLLKQCFLIGITGMMISFLCHAPIIITRYTEGIGNNLGQLALAMQAFLLLSIMFRTFNDAAFPVISRSTLYGDGKDFLYVKNCIRIGTLLSVIGALTAIETGPFFVNLLFGAKYSKTGQLLGQVLLLIIPLIWGSTINSLYFAKCHYLKALLCAFLGGASFLFSLFFFISPIEITDVILCTASGMIVWSVALVVMMDRHERKLILL